MKVGCVICGPDVASGPLALLSGKFEEKVQKAATLGYDGIELMVRDPAGLDWPYVKRTLDDAGLQTPQVVTGELFGADGLRLVTPDEDLYRRAMTAHAIRNRSGRFFGRNGEHWAAAWAAGRPVCGRSVG